MAMVQISSNTGPIECAFAVAKITEKMIAVATARGLTSSLLEVVEGPSEGTFKSVLLEIGSEENQQTAYAFCQEWHGTILWVAPSTFRPECRRKNWFVDISIFKKPQMIVDSDIIFEVMRSSGPGGQHANKTESAVRATHHSTGIAVKVQSERSQHANKKIAKRILEQRISLINQGLDDSLKGEMRSKHHSAVRGNAIRKFVGVDFKEF